MKLWDGMVEQCHGVEGPHLSSRQVGSIGGHCGAAPLVPSHHFHSLINTNLLDCYLKFWKVHGNINLMWWQADMMTLAILLENFYYIIIFWLCRKYLLFCFTYYFVLLNFTINLSFTLQINFTLNLPSLSS